MASTPRATSPKGRTGEKAPRAASSNAGSSRKNAPEPTSKKSAASGRGSSREQAASKRSSPKAAATSRTTARSSAAQIGTGSKAPARRAASKTSRRKRHSQSEGWASSIGSLGGSDLGREILADVLEAATAVLRKSRQAGEDAASTMRATADAGVEYATDAVEAGADVASGAMDAGERITGAAVDMAEAAAGALATMATGAMLNLLPEGSSNKRGSPAADT